MPDKDLPALQTAGFAALVGPGPDTNEIVKFIRANIH
jgi:methylmalonyl-CoA mutase cobalamin-binding subunit